MCVLGYVRGSNLSSGHHFYRRDVDGVRTHKVHVCVSGHWQIERPKCSVLSIFLGAIPVFGQQYQDLKFQLESSNRGGIGEYLAQKAPFIDALMAPHPSLLKE
ncbi:GrpB family protein [Cupriavidus basilensis]